MVPLSIPQYGQAPEGGRPQAAGIVLTTIGFSPDFLKTFIDECSKAAVSNAKTNTTFYKFSENIETFRAVRRPTRPLRTIDLDLKTKEQLVQDIQRYLHPASFRFYATRGIPHRRGYLFHGPPGTGKTSMSVTLAGHFHLDLYIINLAAFPRGDAALADTFETLPRKCIVLLEDIDSAGIKRENIRRERGQDNVPKTKGKPSKAKNSITLSGLLNAIDGATSQEGRVLIMTSNDPEALDEALIRPGRIDMQIFFGPVSQRVAEHIFIRMYTRDAHDSALSYTSTESNSKNQSRFTKLIRSLTIFSWWIFLMVWIIPPTWAVSVTHYLCNIEIVISKLLLGVGIYTAVVIVLFCWLAIFIEKREPTTSAPEPTLGVSAVPLKSQLQGEPAVPDGSSMTNIELEKLREMARKFGSRVPENRFTPAEIQGYLIMNMEDPAAALAGIDGWVARLLAAKDRGMNIVPEDTPSEHTPKPNVGCPSTPPDLSNHRNEALAATDQRRESSDQNVVFLEGSPSSHNFRSATRGYKKLTAYYCYNPKGAPTNLDEKKRQQETVQYFRQASKALEAIDGREAIPSDRYRLSRGATFSPTETRPASSPDSSRDESFAVVEESDEMTDADVTTDDNNFEEEMLQARVERPVGASELAPQAISNVDEILQRQQASNAQRTSRGGGRPAKLNYTRRGGIGGRKEYY
ncbi:hypothetical protein MMC26_003468 [Xylographa opegraphella]|nr:hypothetical protein [Xylographa opegraphella]